MVAAILNRIKNKEKVNEKELDIKVPKKEENDSKAYDYGLDDLYRIAGRLLWCCKESKEKSKKVILTNPWDCRNKINLKGMIAKWKGTGHIEWEFILAGLFIHDVVNAIENDDQEADLTFMFNLDFHDKNGNTFTAQQVYDHLIKSFTIVDETDTELKLKFCI